MFKDTVRLDIRLLQDGHHCVSATLNKFKPYIQNDLATMRYMRFVQYFQSLLTKYSYNY